MQIQILLYSNTTSVAHLQRTQIGHVLLLAQATELTCLFMRITLATVTLS